MLLTAILTAILAVNGFAYTGSLTAPTGLHGTGFWINDPQDPQAYPGWFPATISWEVTYNPGGWWRYSYTLQVYRAAVSHFTIETSPDFGPNDIFNATGGFGHYTIGTWNPGPGNPYMPESIYGIKFDETAGTTLNVAFDSYREPVWGDFYAKCGAVGGTQNTAWNAGFSAPDPEDPIGNGSVAFHILVPDTTVVIPEPSGLIALSAGVLGALGLMRRRK